MSVTHLLIVCCVLFPFTVNARPSNETVEISAESFAEVLSRKTTEACRLAAAYCVAEDECPPQFRAQVKGLCHTPGTECCAILPVSITDCEARGGFCGKCRLGPRDNFAVCPEGQSCCILI